MSARWKPSVTVAAIIERMVDGQSQFLLVEEETIEGLRLNNPAGHLDEGESPQEGAAREVLEETTYRFTPECFVGVYLSRYQRPARSEDITYLRLTFAGRVGEPDISRSLDKGIVRTLWLSLPELHAARERLRSNLVLTCIEDYLAGRRYPLDMVHADGTLVEPEIKR